MTCQLVEPEVTMTEIIRQHLAMGMKIIDNFSADQRKELKKYSVVAKRKSKKIDCIKKGDSCVKEKDGDKNDDSNVSPTTIPFKTISFLHTTLLESFKTSSKDVADSAGDDDAPCVYLHELLRGSTLHIPELPKPERNPELEARCRRLRLEQQEREYQQMVGDVCTCGHWPVGIISDFRRSNCFILLFWSILSPGDECFRIHSFYVCRFSLRVLESCPVDVFHFDRRG